MKKGFPSNNKAFTLGLDIHSTRPMKIAIEAHDKLKPATYYYKTKGDINGNRRWNLVFPQSPNQMIVNVYDAKFKSYQDYQRFADQSIRDSFSIVREEVLPLKTTPIWLSPEDLSFIKFAKRFSDNASIYSATNPDLTPSIYRSDDGKYTIDYYNKILDRKTKQPVNTPARIGHQTGVIEVSKKDFLKYTVPMRMIILLHEYSHKWKNPASGVRIDNESGADINALYIYLSLGYSPIEAHQAFLYVFDGANNAQNKKRYLILNKFIDDFYAGRLTQFVKEKNAVSTKK